MAKTFIGVYRGRTVAEAELVCVTSEERVVGQVLRALAGVRPEPEGEHSVGAPLQLVKTDPAADDRDG